MAKMNWWRAGKEARDSQAAKEGLVPARNFRFIRKKRRKKKSKKSK